MRFSLSVANGHASPSGLQVERMEKECFVCCIITLQVRRAGEGFVVAACICRAVLAHVTRGRRLFRHPASVKNDEDKKKSFHFLYTAEWENAWKNISRNGGSMSKSRNNEISTDRCGARPPNNKKLEFIFNQWARKKNERKERKTEAQTHTVFIPFVRHLNNFQSLCQGATGSSTEKKHKKASRKMMKIFYRWMVSFHPPLPQAAAHSTPHVRRTLKNRNFPHIDWLWFSLCACFFWDCFAMRWIYTAFVTVVSISQKQTHKNIPLSITLHPSCGARKTTPINRFMLPRNIRLPVNDPTTSTHFPDSFVWGGSDCGCFCECVVVGHVTKKEASLIEKIWWKATEEKKTTTSNTTRRETAPWRTNKWDERWSGARLHQMTQSFPGSLRPPPLPPLPWTPRGANRPCSVWGREEKEWWQTFGILAQLVHTLDGCFFCFVFFCSVRRSLCCSFVCFVTMLPCALKKKTHPQLHDTWPSDIRRAGCPWLLLGERKVPIIFHRVMDMGRGLAG